MRIFSAEALEALDSGRFVVRSLIKVTLSDGDKLCLWDDVGTITVGGDTYTGAPGRFTLSPSMSTKDGTVRPLDVTLSGLDAEVAALIDQTEWAQAPILVQRAVIALDVPTVLHVVPEFAGRLDQMSLRDEATSTLKFRCESASREKGRSGARTRSDADQRQRAASDGFFEFAATAINTPINWGRAPQKAQRTQPQRKGGLAGLLDQIF